MAGKSRHIGGMEYPPHSRLFIICPKSLQEKDFHQYFDEFGKIEEIYVVKDRNDGENKGVCYIQFSKTSEAAKAMEVMNGKVLNTGRGIKVVVAASREEGKKDANNEDTLHRLFVIVPRSMNDDELYDYFKQFGDVMYANIIRDRTTKESKGFAYVKFSKFSEAALAFENCERKYRPVFAEPKKSREERMQEDLDRGFDSYNRNDSFASTRSGRSDRNDYGLHNRSYESKPEALPIDVADGGYHKLLIIGCPELNQDMVWRLFDLIPTMDYCDVALDIDSNLPARVVGEVVYNSSHWAAYAREKLHGFEYPPGFRLIVRPDFESAAPVSRRRGAPKRPAPGSSDSKAIGKPDLMQIAETLKQATSLIQAAGLPADILQTKFGIGTSRSFDESMCSVTLPEKQPLVHIDSETAARCFIVSTPSALPGVVLKDIFCRFGNLIDVYMLANRNCGYAKYANKQSAEAAIKTLHGAEVQGMRIKVMEAEERNDSKRAKMDTN